MQSQAVEVWNAAEVGQGTVRRQRDESGHATCDEPLPRRTLRSTTATPPKVIEDTASLDHARRAVGRQMLRVHNALNVLVSSRVAARSAGQVSTHVSLDTLASVDGALMEVRALVAELERLRGDIWRSVEHVDDNAIAAE